MAWVFRKNRVPAYKPGAMFHIKECLVEAGWVVMASSDGTTYSATGDVITHDGTGAGGPTNSAAWIRLRAPNGQEIVFQAALYAPTTANYGAQWNIARSPSAGFVLPSPAPSATVRPQAADEVVVIGGTSAVNGVVVMSNTLGNGLFSFDIIADNAAPYGVFAVGHITGTSTTIFFWALDPTDTDDPNEEDHYVDWISRNGNIPTVASQAASYAYGFTATVLGGSYVPVVALNFSLFPTDYSGWDREFAIPLYRNTSQPAPNGIKGTSAIRIHSPKRATMDTASVLTSRDRLIIDDMSIPWDGSVPTL